MPWQLVGREDGGYWLIGAMFDDGSSNIHRILYEIIKDNYGHIGTNNAGYIGSMRVDSASDWET